MITSTGVGVEQFYHALKTVIAEDASNNFYVEVLLAATDYTNFVQMMNHYKREHPKHKSWYIFRKYHT